MKLSWPIDEADFLPIAWQLDSETPAYLVDTTVPAEPAKPTPAVAAGPEQTDEFGLPMHA
jgi:hypothetical protein